MGFRANFLTTNAAATAQITTHVFATRLRSNISIGFISLSGERPAFFKLSFSARVRAENKCRSNSALRFRRLTGQVASAALRPPSGV
jgi:hypothetical protein